MNGGKWERQEEIKSCWPESDLARWPDGALGSHLLHLQLIQLDKPRVQRAFHWDLHALLQPVKETSGQEIISTLGIQRFPTSWPPVPENKVIIHIPLCIHMKDACELFSTSVRAKQRRKSWEVNIRNLAGKSVRYWIGLLEGGQESFWSKECIRITWSALKMWTPHLSHPLSHSDIHSNRWKSGVLKNLPNDSDVYAVFPFPNSSDNHHPGHSLLLRSYNSTYSDRHQCLKIAIGDRSLRTWIKKRGLFF